MENRCILVGIEDHDASSLDELAALADSAGLEVVARTIQRRNKANAVHYVGKGKLEEIKELAEASEADIVIFDNELTPNQHYNINKALEIDVEDRTSIILTIFAQRARSREGKVQVELARLKYLLPRLTGKGTSMSRLGGGIGTRGPGESKLETDKRRIRRRIHELEKRIKQIGLQRELTRQKRRDTQVPAICLVGYTNAGKSSLLQKLAGSEVYVDDRLFATLDTTVRRLRLPGGGEVVLSDTVGFIDRLPHQLVAAFRATLEEIIQADLLIHVVDVSGEDAEERIASVEKVLDEIGATARQEIMVYNKADLLPNSDIQQLPYDLPEGIMVSAVTGQGIEELMGKLEEVVFEATVETSITIPHNRGDIVNRLYKRGLVLKREEGDDGVILDVKGQVSVINAVINEIEGDQRDHG
ncbi:MAG: GTPase HflX [Acidobacteriota bacterium]